MKLYKQKASGRTVEVGEGFNGWAFLFGIFWYLYKGMIGRAVLIFIRQGNPTALLWLGKKT